MQSHLILYILYKYTRYDTVQIMQSLFYIYSIFFPFVIISGTFTFKKNLDLRKISLKKYYHYLKFLEFLNCEPTSAKKLHYLRETIKK